MLVRLAIHPDQIRYWAESAINGFETLDAETAAENAKADLRAILRYLDRTDDAVTVLGIKPVESDVRTKGSVSDDDICKKPDLEVVRS